MVRDALVALLNMEPDFDVVAHVACGDEILTTAQRCHPDVAVIDIALPGRDGLTAATEIHEKLPECRTLILTGFGQPGTVRRALSAHVGGFLLKDAPVEKLASAIREVAAGRRVMDSDLAMSAWEPSHCPLTGRELEVLRLAADGADAAEIAGCLCLSVGTVRNYLTSIVAKLNARTRVDAIRLVTEAGWL
jgi:two-component system response regulator DesR